MEVIEPFSSFIQRFTILLHKRSDFRSQLGGLVWWEVLAKEHLGEIVLSGKRLSQVSRPCLSFLANHLPYPAMKKEVVNQLRSKPNCAWTNPIKLNGIAFHKEIVKMDMGVVCAMSTKLFSLHKGHLCRAKLKVICFNP